MISAAVVDVYWAVEPRGFSAVRFREARIYMCVKLGMMEFWRVDAKTSSFIICNLRGYIRMGR